MCEMLGSEPQESDIPVELSDFPDEVQTAFQVYQVLQDHWEGMSGTFLGKDYSIAFELFATYEIAHNSDKQLLLRIMSITDGIRSRIIVDKQKQREQKPSK